MNLKLPDHAVSDRVSVIRQIPPNEPSTFAVLDGPGCIRHLWLCTNRTPLSVRRIVIRIYFDGSDIPHVEAPLGDLFGVMHGQQWYPINTDYLSVMQDNGYNLYFPMPFAKSARFECSTPNELQFLYMQVDWHRYPGQELEEPKRFCSRWRREYPTARYGDDYLMLDADGPGALAGYVYGVRLIDNIDRWSHGGGDNIYIDGEGRHPAYLRGTGGEDSFGVSWGGAIHTPETHLHAAMPYYKHEDVSDARPAQRVVGYRFFNKDTISFEHSLHMRFGCMCNDICSTVYWYQEKPPRPFTIMPPWSHITPWEREAHSPELPAGSFDLNLPPSGQWWVCGPFGNAHGKAMTIEHPAESHFDPDECYDGLHEENSPWLNELSTEMGRNEARWIKRDAFHNFIDFRHVFRPCMRGACPTHPGVALARSTLHAPENGNAELMLTWDDHMILRVNNEAPIDLEHHKAFRSRSLTVALQKGPNTILLKNSNETGTNWGGWTFCFQARLADGTVLLPSLE